MNFSSNKKVFVVILLMVAGLFLSFLFSKDEVVDFSADVKPILNKKCITCHGGVRAKAGFSVLFREDALAKTESGKPAIIPGDPDHSEMIRRVRLDDPEDRMPYKHPPLTSDEIDILSRWISQGAKWGDHWAYLPVKPAAPPAVSDPWIKNDVDRFILDRLHHEKLNPAAAADKATLLRRVSLDLIGKYPSDQIAHQYLNSNSPGAYELLVDSLLASPHYGERWASMWLDLARYADTKGYEADVGRSIWRYRDWVIRAFNEDKPYDRFLTEQIAGDLLPDPSDAQYIATAFHRNTMTNDEGGTNNEEFRTAAVIDRVNTTWEALMGTTFSCVQCHSHPYDPFRHEEYYSFLAYFNNTRDEDQSSEFPLLRIFDTDQSDELKEVLAWVKKYGVEGQAQETKKLLRTWQPGIYTNTADSLHKAVIANNNGDLMLHDKGLFRIARVDLDGRDEIILYYASPGGGRLTAHLDSPDGEVLSAAIIPPSYDWQLAYLPAHSRQGVHDIYFSFAADRKPEKKEDFQVSANWVAFARQFPGRGEPGYEAMHAAYRSLLEAKTPTTPVMVENPATRSRTTRVFERGNRMTLGNEVKPAVPASLRMAMPANAPANRVGLAMWLTDDKNPLVSRTIVNRLWEQLFGAGIAETLEDMGTQGIPPTHQQLLDHYAYVLMHDYKWSLKKLLKELVMSATYRQDSRVSEELKQKDPYNKLYARGPRTRLSAEQLRDQDLCISGVMSEKMYGKGVMPWQPAGLWNSPYNGADWENSKGEDRYRRAIYTYWKRSSPYPSMISFDGAQRVVCSARRIRTNTPLQALVTLNDSAYIDMSAQFALCMLKNGENAHEQIGYGYERMMYRPASPGRIKVLLSLYETAKKEFEVNKGRSMKISGDKPVLSSADGAAILVVANAMLNLDEVVTKN